MSLEGGIFDVATRVAPPELGVGIDFWLRTPRNPWVVALKSAPCRICTPLRRLAKGADGIAAHEGGSASPDSFYFAKAARFQFQFRTSQTEVGGSFLLRAISRHKKYGACFERCDLPNCTNPKRTEMKTTHLLFGLGWMLLSLGAIAQQALPVQGFARQKQSTEWYRQQVQAWKRETEKEPRNAKAWYNYYRASRNLSLSDTADTRSREAKFLALSSLVAQMEKKVPDSYEYHLIRWLNGGNNEELLPHLQKAEALGADRYEHLEDLIVWKEMEGRTAERNAAGQRWFASGQTSPGLLNYTYNVLAGLPENAILITAGDNDTFPAWILQARGFRSDVLVLNTSLLQKELYRKRIFGELGIADLPLDFSASAEIFAAQQQAFEKKLVERLAANKKARTVCLGLTCASQEGLSLQIENKLYLAGLHHEYRTEPTETLSKLRKNFETAFALDYLKAEFSNDVSRAWVLHLNRNYTIPMLKLFHHYQEAGDCRQAQRMKELLERVAKGQPEENTVQEHLRKSVSCP